MDRSPNLDLPYIMPAQAQKHVTHNEAVRTLDAIVHLSLVSRQLAAPPTFPSEGDRYLVASPATGIWSGHESAIAAFQDGAWAFLTPRQGWIARVADEARVIVHDGVEWSPVGANADQAPMFGVNTLADATNRLAVKSDAVLLSHDDVTPGSGDFRLNLNKSAPAATASLTFQSAWSGRAEFGLTGNDDFNIKVSADGVSWTDAMAISAATGFVGVGTSTPLETLHIKAASGSVRMLLENANPSSNANILLKTGSADWNFGVGVSNIFRVRDSTFSFNPLVIEANSLNNAIYIAAGGNVGIGNVLNPSVPLHVNGAVRHEAVTVANLPAPAAAGQGARHFVTDATSKSFSALVVGGGPHSVPVYCDGTNWRVG